MEPSTYAWGTVFTSEYCMGYSIHGGYGGTVFPDGVQYSLVNLVWGTVFTGEYCMDHGEYCMDTVFTSESCMGYSIH